MGKRPKRSPEEEKEAHKRATRAWRQRNPAKVKEHQERRRKNNPETIKAYNRRQSKRDVERVTDTYLRSMLKQSTGIDPYLFPPEFLDAQRALILLRRLVRELR